jgi:hypothetical protein
MNTEEYLEWFRSNYDLMQRHFDGALLFDVNYDTTGCLMSIMTLPDGWLDMVISKIMMGHIS